MAQPPRVSDLRSTARVPTSLTPVPEFPELREDEARSHSSSIPAPGPKSSRPVATMNVLLPTERSGAQGFERVSTAASVGSVESSARHLGASKPSSLASGVSGAKPGDRRQPGLNSQSSRPSSDSDNSSSIAGTSFGTQIWDPGQQQQKRGMFSLFRRSNKDKDKKDLEPVGENDDVWSDSDEGSFEGDERILGHHQTKPIFLTPEQKMRIWRQTEDAHGVLDKHDRADEALWTRFQRRVGVLQVRMYIAYKKQVVEEEPAPFPTARDLCKSVKFEAFIGILIILNGILIGIDAMYKPGEDKPAIFAVAENWFTLLFLLEFVARIMAFTWVWMFTPMNAFDTFLIWVTGVLTNWVLTPAGVNADMIQRLAALRVLRLGRLCRAVRMMPLFHELWMLVQGVMECMSLLFWATVIIFSILYMFSVAMVEVITKSETFADDELVQDVFGNLHESMYTLFQIMTFDSWASIVRPIVFKMPEIIPLFLLFVGIAGLVLFNLMTAIVVKNAFEAAEEDVEARLKLEQDQQARHKEQLEDMFAELDKDDSGMLSKQEFAESVLDDMVFIQQLKTLDIELEELPDVFEILDDGDGEVSTQEFCDGLMRMQGNAMSKDMLKATKKAKNVNEFFERVLMCVENLAAKRPDAYPEQQSTLDRVEIALDDAHYHFNEMQAMSAEVLKKLDSVGLRRAVKAVSSVLPTMQEPETSGLGETLTEQREREHEMKMKIKNAQQNPDKFMQPLPTEWIHSRKMEKQQAMLMRQLSGEEDDIEDVAAPCVAQEFQKQWEDLEMWRPEMTFGEVMQVPEHPEEDQDPVSKLKAQGKIRTLPSTLVEAKVWEPTEEPAEAVVEKPSPWRSTRHKPQQPEPSHPHSVPQELRISDL